MKNIQTYYTTTYYIRWLVNFSLFRYSILLKNKEIIIDNNKNSIDDIFELEGLKVNDIYIIYYINKK